MIRHHDESRPCGRCNVYTRRGVFVGRKRPCPDCIHWKGRVPKDCRCGGTRWLYCDCADTAYRRPNVGQEESPILLAAVADCMRAGGWDDLSLFKTPSGVLADWCGDHGRDDYAALLADLSFVVYFRDHLWLHCDRRDFAEMARYVRAMAKQLATRDLK